MNTSILRNNILDLLLTQQLVNEVFQLFAERVAGGDHSDRLAVLDDRREEELPDVPTAKEQGVNVVNLMWRAVLAPKGTPRPIIDTLALAFKKMTEDKSVIGMIKKFGDDIQYLGPDGCSRTWPRVGLH